MLQDLGSDHLPILLSVPLSPVFRPNERPPSFNFQKARWDGFAFYFDFYCPSAEKYSSLLLSSAAALFTSLALNAAKSSILFGRIKRPPKAWWSAEVEEAVSERRKAFAAVHRSDEDRQAYISASRRASSVIAKAKAEAWQTTCSSLSPRSNPKSVHSLLRSITGSSSLSSSSPNFPSCFSPRESALIYAAYLRSHFSVSQPKALRSRARGYLSELRRATCSVESHSSFCSPFSPAKFHAAASNLSSSTATGVGITNKSAISLLFSSYLILVLSSPPCPLLHLSSHVKLCGRSGRNCLLSPVLSGYNGSPDTRFSRGNDTVDELIRRGALLAPSANPCSLSPLISRIHSCLFSDWRRTVSSKYFDTQVPSLSTEELALPCHARCVLSRLRCNGHSLFLISYLFRIGRIENPSCSACGHSTQDTSHLVLHCPSTDSLRRSLFGDFLSLYDLWSRPWGVARVLGLHGLPPCPIPRKRSGNQQQQNRLFLN